MRLSVCEDSRRSNHMSADSATSRIVSLLLPSSFVLLSLLLSSSKRAQRDMVWDLRPHLPTVRSMSSLPMAGLAFAVGSKSNVAATTMTTTTTATTSSRISSPPPEYDNQAQASGQVRSVLPVAAELERALLFGRSQEEALGRLRYASQGSIMLRSSQDAVLAAASEEELRFARELYLTSLDYILRGVPTELSPLEKEGLSRSVTQLYARLDIRDLAGTREGTHAEAARTQQLFVGLCRGTATLVKLSVPRIRQGLESAVAFERQYRVLDRTGSVLSASLITIADRASRTAVTLPDVSRLTGLANGIAHGVYLGVWEGYRVLAEDSPSS